MNQMVILKCQPKCKFVFSSFANGCGRRWSERDGRASPHDPGCYLFRKSCHGQVPYSLYRLEASALQRSVLGGIVPAQQSLAVLKGKNCETSQTWVRIREPSCQVIVHGWMPTVGTQGSLYQKEKHLIEVDCQCQKGEGLPPNPPNSS